MNETCKLELQNIFMTKYKYANLDVHVIVNVHTNF